MKWTIAIAIGWGLLLGTSLVQSNLPASWWFDVRSVTVSDTTTADQCAPMDVDRTINRPFEGRWVLTIMRQKASGSYYTYRTFPGSSDYNPDNEAPDDATLCWWAESDDFHLFPGTYRVHILWSLDVDGGVRHVRRRSPPFQVTKKGPQHDG